MSDPWPKGALKDLFSGFFGGPKPRASGKYRFSDGAADVNEDGSITFHQDGLYCEGRMDPKVAVEMAREILARDHGWKPK